MPEHVSPPSRPGAPQAPDRRQLRRQRTRAAPGFDAAAVLARTVADQLIERLEVVRMQPARILEVGCATGYATRALARRYRRTPIVGMDPAAAMAHTARRNAGWFSPARFAVGEIDALPFADGSFDLVLSNLLVQWSDPATTFPELLRVLRPGGLLAFASVGPDTLQELRQAWHEADALAPMQAFLDMHDVGDDLVRAGFADPVIDVERYTLTYASVRDVLRELKALGAQNALPGRRRTLTGRRRLERFVAAYEGLRQRDRIPVSVEVVYAHAWVPEQKRDVRRGSVAIPLSQIRRRR